MPYSDCKPLKCCLLAPSKPLVSRNQDDLPEAALDRGKVRWSAWGGNGKGSGCEQSCGLQLLYAAFIIHGSCMLDMLFKDCDAFASVECCTKSTSLKLAVRSHCADLSRSLTARIRRMTCLGNTCARALAASLADLHLCLLVNPRHQPMTAPAASKAFSAGRRAACLRVQGSPFKSSQNPHVGLGKNPAVKFYTRAVLFAAPLAKR